MSLGGTHVQSFMDYYVKQFASKAGAATDCLYLRTNEVMSGLTIAVRKEFFLLMTSKVL